MSDVVQSLWIGPRLSAMERLSIESFLRHGHAFHLYTYGDVGGVPPGAVVRDGAEILPPERIFTYREHASVSGFSNLFRYKLLLERGGWWVDTDMVCLAPFVFDAEHVFSSEFAREKTFVNCGAIKAPRGSEAMAFAWEVCSSKDPASLRWGEIGPSLMVEVVERFALHDAVQPPHVFCPIPHFEWERILDGDDPVELPRESAGVHLWNEKWRRAGRDKDAAYDPRCLYERLKRGPSPGAARHPLPAARGEGTKVGDRHPERL
jgi:hypothetical protein